jgi:PhnB protein
LPHDRYFDNLQINLIVQTGGIDFLRPSPDQKSNTMEKSKKNKSVRAVPEGFETVTPYLVVDNAQKLIDFIKNAFNGEVTFISNRDDNKIMHATVKIGSSTIMISDTMEGMQAQTAMLYLYLEDVDGVFKKATQAKATSIVEPKNEFYGDRAGAVKDEWGNVWWIATHVEDVGPEELERRSQEVQKEQKNKPEMHHA